MEIKNLKGQKYKPNTKHDLIEVLKEFIVEYEDHFKTKFHQRIYDLIKEFNKIDPSSQKFRYCSDKKGHPIKRDGLHVGFMHLESDMGEIYSSLESIEATIDATKDGIQEMLEYRYDDVSAEDCYPVDDY